MSTSASVVAEDQEDLKANASSDQAEEKRISKSKKSKEKSEKSSHGEIERVKGKVDKKLRSVLQAMDQIGKKVDQNEGKLNAIKDEQVKFSSEVSGGMDQLKKATAEQGEVMKDIHQKLEAKSGGRERSDGPLESKPSRWQRFMNKMSSFWRGTKKGGEKVGEGAGAVGSAGGRGIRAIGHEMGEVMRGVDDVLRDTTKLLIGKGAGNVMKYGSYAALGAPSWMPKVWNFLTGKDSNGKPIEKKTLSRKAAMAAAWTAAGLSLAASPWNLVWMGIPTISWGMNALGKKFVQEADKPEGFKVTSRVLGGAGAVYGATVSGGFLTASFLLKGLGTGALGWLYRKVRRKEGSNSDNEERETPSKNPEPEKASVTTPAAPFAPIQEGHGAAHAGGAAKTDLGHGGQGQEEGQGKGNGDKTAVQAQKDPGENAEPHPETSQEEEPKDAKAGHTNQAPERQQSATEAGH